MTEDRTFPLTREEFEDIKAQYLRAFGVEPPKLQPEPARDQYVPSTTRVALPW